MWGLVAQTVSGRRHLWHQFSLPLLAAADLDPGVRALLGRATRRTRRPLSPCAPHPPGHRPFYTKDALDKEDEMTTATPQIRLHRVIPASRHEVYRAWLEPDVLRRWLAPGDAGVTRIEVDECVGGRFRIWRGTDSGRRRRLRVRDSRTCSPTPSRISLGLRRPTTGGWSHVRFCPLDHPGGCPGRFGPSSPLCTKSSRRCMTPCLMFPKTCWPGWELVLNKLEKIVPRAH